MTVELFPTKINEGTTFYFLSIVLSAVVCSLFWARVSYLPPYPWAVFERYKDPRVAVWLPWLAAGHCMDVLQ